MKCPARHTPYQPKDEEFKCPKCQATPDSNPAFYIENSDTKAIDSCELLHAEDELFCEGCKEAWDGLSFSQKISKMKNLVACPHCKGRGLVTKDEASPRKVFKIDVANLPSDQVQDIIRQVRERLKKGDIVDGGPTKG